LSKTNVIPLNNQYKKSENFLKTKTCFWGKFHTPKGISFAFNRRCGTIPRGGGGVKGIAFVCDKSKGISFDLINFGGGVLSKEISFVF